MQELSSHLLCHFRKWHVACQPQVERAGTAAVRVAETEVRMLCIQAHKIPSCSFEFGPFSTLKCVARAYQRRFPGFAWRKNRNVKCYNHNVNVSII